MAKATLSSFLESRYIFEFCRLMNRRSCLLRDYRGLCAQLNLNCQSIYEENDDMTMHILKKWIASDVTESNLDKLRQAVTSLRRLDALEVIDVFIKDSPSTNDSKDTIVLFYEESKSKRSSLMAFALWLKQKGCSVQIGNSSSTEHKLAGRLQRAKTIIIVMNMSLRNIVEENYTSEGGSGKQVRMTHFWLTLLTSDSNIGFLMRSKVVLVSMANQLASPQLQKLLRFPRMFQLPQKRMELLDYVRHESMKTVFSSIRGVASG